MNIFLQEKTCTSDMRKYNIQRSISNKGKAQVNKIITLNFQYALDLSYIHIMPHNIITQFITPNNRIAITFTYRYNLFHILPGTENPLSISISLPESVSTVLFNAFSFCRCISCLCSFLLHAHAHTHAQALTIYAVSLKLKCRNY